MTKNEKFALIKDVSKKLDKQFDQKSTLQKLGNKVGLPRPSISTGFPSIDWGVLGCGGFPRGRIVELYGLESSGKTAFACNAISECQKAGGVAAFVDAEHALDPTFAAKLGVDMSELIVSQPDCGEQALETVIALVEAGAVDLIVIDSVAALVPRAEIDGEMGDSHMGLQARLMSQAMRKLVGIVSKKDVTVIFINQIRSKVGLVFGSPNVTTGGLGLKFYATIRLELSKVSATDKGPIKDGDKFIGHKIRMKAQKNKVSPPFREGIVTLYYDTGFDKKDDVLTHALSLGILTGSIKFQFRGGPKTDRDELDYPAIRKAIDDYYHDLSKKLKIELDETEESDENEDEESAPGQ